MILALEVVAVVVLTAYVVPIRVCGRRVRVRWHRLLLHPKDVLTLWDLWRRS